jgi:hypothetical protein
MKLSIFKLVKFVTSILLTVVFPVITITGTQAYQSQIGDSNKSDNSQFVNRNNPNKLSTHDKEELEKYGD